MLMDSEVAASYRAGPDTLSTSEGTRISTALAGEISTNSARLNAIIQPNTFPTSVYFEYGRTTNYGMATPVVDAGNGTNMVSVGSIITNLTPGAIYHFRCVATNADGTIVGGDTLFISLPFITRFSRSTNGQFKIQFEAQAATHYFFAQVTNLVPMRWTSLTNAWITTNGICTFTDSTAVNFPRRYYRVMVRDW
jgi:hypothetical protein